LVLIESLIHAETESWTTISFREVRAWMGLSPQILPRVGFGP
jgi:hypothetical protein